MTKFWKGKIGTRKEGHYGMMADTGNVPDADEISELEYNAWRSLQPKIIPRDWKAELAAANNLEQRVTILEQFLGLK